MTKPVQIYTIPTCSDCNNAKRFFKEQQVPFEEFNCEENEEYPKIVWELTGKQVVPTIVIGDQVFVGFADHFSEIRELVSQQ